MMTNIVFKNTTERSKKISDKLTGRKLSKIHAQNIRKSLLLYYARGGDNTMKNKKHSELSKRLMSIHASSHRQDIQNKISKSHLQRYTNNPDLRKEVSIRTKKGMTNVDMSKIVKHAYAMHPEYREKIRLARLKQMFPVKDTGIETKMQEVLLRHQVLFTKNKELLNRYKVDIFIEPNIVIECDGCFYHACKQCKMTKYHQYSTKRDAEKTKILRENNFVVYRFWGHDINASADKCFEKIIELQKQTIDKSLNKNK